MILEFCQNDIFHNVEKNSKWYSLSVSCGRVLSYFTTIKLFDIVKEKMKYDTLFMNFFHDSRRVRREFPHFLIFEHDVSIFFLLRKKIIPFYENAREIWNSVNMFVFRSSENIMNTKLKFITNLREYILQNELMKYHTYHNDSQFLQKTYTYSVAFLCMTRIQRFEILFYLKIFWIIYHHLPSFHSSFSIFPKSFVIPSTFYMSTSSRITNSFSDNFVIVEFAFTFQRIRYQNYFWYWFYPRDHFLDYSHDLWLIDVFWDLWVELIDFSFDRFDSWVYIILMILSRFE